MLEWDIACGLGFIPKDDLEACHRKFDPPRRAWLTRFVTLRALFTKFLTPGLTHEFYNPLDDWLSWLIPANHQADNKIRGLTQQLKNL